MIDYKVGANVKGQASLDPHHTHFFLVDDGTYNLPNQKLPYASRHLFFLVRRQHQTLSEMILCVVYTLFSLFAGSFLVRHQPVL